MITSYAFGYCFGFKAGLSSATVMVVVVFWTLAMKLYTWWRSQAAFRVRIALGMKGIDAEMVFVDLSKDEQTNADYHALNPEMVLPTLIDDEGPVIAQSLAIIEYLDEKFPSPPLLPDDIRTRAHSRALAQIVASEAHPLIVPRVRNYLGRQLSLSDHNLMQWLRHWLDTTSGVLEEYLANDPRTGRFCCGDQPTIADICLIPHLTSAEMLYDCDLTKYPTAHRIFDECMQLEAFARAHPMQQADALHQ